MQDVVAGEALHHEQVEADRGRDLRDLDHEHDEDAIMMIEGGIRSPSVPEAASDPMLVGS